MGLNNKVGRLLGQKVPSILEIVKKEYKKSSETYYQKENAFLEELNQVLKPTIYTQEALEKVCANNATYGKAFKDLNPKEHKKVFDEINEICVARLEVEAHTEKFDPPVFVFVYADNDQAVYVNGILTDMGQSDTSDPQKDVRWLATCIIKGGKAPVVQIESSEQLENYLENNNEKFPKWLKELSFIKEPKYYPVREKKSEQKP